MSLILTSLGLMQGQRATPESYVPVRVKAAFVRSDGSSIVLNTWNGTLVTPRSRSTGLQDCGDTTQVCLTDHRGFAFAYFRKCDDATAEGYRSLRFSPKVVTAVHNRDMWMVFDAAPRYLFHYAYSKGIVGIYLAPTPSFDFRSVLRDRNFQVEKLDSAEYRITGSQDVAACTA
jgi:hypothetical protein